MCLDNSSKGSLKRLNAASLLLSSKKEVWNVFMQKMHSIKHANYIIENALLFFKPPFNDHEENMAIRAKKIKSFLKAAQLAIFYCSVP
jgi:hypothetical protein